MQLISYLTFDGRCESAFKFYEQCFGGKIEAMIPHTGTPAEGHVPAEWRDKIMHARLSVNGSLLMGSDAPPERYTEPKGFSVNITLGEPREAERIFHELSQGGRVSMPLQQTFWATRFGMLVDRFGISWMVNCMPAGSGIRSVA